MLNKDTDLRSQNDNSKPYREKRAKQVKQLLKKALAAINSLERDGDNKAFDLQVYTHPNISKAMAALATSEDIELKANITANAIGVNTDLRNYIETYKLQNDKVKSKLKKSNLSNGDLAFELHKCKTLLAQKTDETKILKDIIEKENIPTKQTTSRIHKPPEFDYKSLLKEAYRHMISDGTVFIYQDNLVLEFEKNKIVATKVLLNELGIE